MDKDTKILIVDDSELMRMQLYHILVEEYDAENLIFADSIEKAWEKVVKNNIDVILLDLYLPGENGTDFINDLLKNTRLKEIPIIVITGVANDSFVNAFYKEYVYSYLQKPVDKIELLKSIKKAKSQ